MTDEATTLHPNSAEDEAAAADAFAEPGLSNYIVARGAAETTPIREKRDPLPGYDAPTSVYLIYLKFAPDPLDANNLKLIVRQLRYLEFAGAGKTLQQAEADLLAMARQATPTGPHFLGSNFTNIQWTREYYLTFVIDNPGWKFYWVAQSDKHEAIRFLERKDSPGNFTVYEDENHSFFDAEPYVNLGDGDAFRCVNYFRTAAGPIGPNNTEVKYCFEVYLQAPFMDAGPESHITMLIDPDGENQGPRT